LWSLFFIFLIRYYVYTFFSCKYIIQTFIKLKIFNLSDVYYQDNTLPEVQKRINIWSEKAKLIVQTSLQLQNLCIYIYIFFFSASLHESDIEVKKTFIFMTKQALVLLFCHQQYLLPVNMTEIFHSIPCFTRHAFHSSFHPSRRFSLVPFFSFLFSSNITRQSRSCLYLQG